MSIAGTPPPAPPVATNTIPHPTDVYETPLAAGHAGYSFATRVLWCSGVPVDYPYTLDDRKGRLRWAIPFWEFRAVGAPPDDMGAPGCPIKVSSIGDTYLDITPGHFTLWVRLDPEEDEESPPDSVWSPGKKWLKWPGVQPDDPKDAPRNPNHEGAQMPFNKDKLIVNPFIYDRFLWSDGKAVAWLATNTIEISRRVMRKAGVFALEDTCTGKQVVPLESGPSGSFATSTRSASAGPSAGAVLVDASPPTPDAMDVDSASAASPAVPSAPRNVPPYEEFERICHHRVLSIMLQSERGEPTAIQLAIPKRTKSTKRDRTSEASRRDRTKKGPAGPGPEATRKSARQEIAASAVDSDDELTEEEDEEDDDEASRKRPQAPEQVPVSASAPVKRQRMDSAPSTNGQATASGSRPPGRPAGSKNKVYPMAPPYVNGRASSRRGQSPVDVRDVRKAAAAAASSGDTGELIMGFHTTVTSRDATIGGRDETISQRDATIKTHTSTINTLTSTIAQQNTSLVALEASVAELNGRIGRRNAELDEHIHTIKDLNTSEKALKADAKKNEATLKQTQTALATLAATNKEQAQSILELSDRVTRRNAEVAEHVATIKRRDQRIAELQGTGKPAAA